MHGPLALCHEKTTGIVLFLFVQISMKNRDPFNACNVCVKGN